jgi:hypothetical protein
VSSREEELKEELALGITMALNAWHLHIGILKVTQYTVCAAHIGMGGEKIKKEPRQ